MVTRYNKYENECVTRQHIIYVSVCFSSYKYIMQIYLKSITNPSAGVMNRANLLPHHYVPIQAQWWQNGTLSMLSD